MAEETTVALPAAGAEAVAATGQPTVAPEEAEVVATAGGAPSAKKAPAKKKQSVLVLATVGAAPPPASTPKSNVSERAEVARTAIAASLAARKHSPTKVTVSWIVENNKTARTRGAHEVVEVHPEGPPLEYYQGPGQRALRPKHQLRCIQLKYMFVLKDGKARRNQTAGKGMICGHCFTLLRMPQFGEENLRAHLASKTCGATAWAKHLSQILDEERPAAEDRRRVVVAEDGTVIIDYSTTKMTWHFETAKMFAGIGFLPSSLFDQPIFNFQGLDFDDHARCIPCAVRQVAVGRQRTGDAAHDRHAGRDASGAHCGGPRVL